MLKPLLFPSEGFISGFVCGDETSAPVNWRRGRHGDLFLTAPRRGDQTMPLHLPISPKSVRFTPKGAIKRGATLGLPPLYLWS